MQDLRPGKTEKYLPLKNGKGRVELEVIKNKKEKLKMISQRF